MGGGEGALFAHEHATFFLGQLAGDGGILVEVGPQLFVDGLGEPVARLFAAAAVEVAVFFDKGHIVVDHFPHLVDAYPVIARVGEHLRFPSRRGGREEVQGVAEVRLCQLGFLDVVAVGLVDDDAVGHLHDAPFDALQFVARAGQLDKEEEVDHRVYGGLGLSHAHGLDEDGVEAGGFAQDNGLAGLTGHAAQRAGRRRGTYEGVFLLRKAFHAGLVAENAPFRPFAAGVDGQHGQFAAPAQHMQPEGVDRRALSRPRHAGDADAHRLPGVGQTAGDDLLCDGLVLGQLALDQRDGLAQHRYVAFDDTLYIFACGV